MKKITRSHKPLILITNDDGIQAKGIREVADFLKPLGDILIVAPDAPRSGTKLCNYRNFSPSHESRRRARWVSRNRTNGTPVDCIKLSMNILLDERPDLIVSGINHGSNSGVSVIYSGTMGAVFEGALLHIPSIGFSLCNHKADADFSHCRELILDVCQKALTHNHWPQNIGLNINIPDVPQLKGSKICRAAQGHWTEEYDCRTDPHGQEYYWLTGKFKNAEPEATDTDEYWLERGYATIVPCTTDNSALNILPELSSVLGI